jgi:hypothetical protein
MLKSGLISDRVVRLEACRGLAVGGCFRPLLQCILTDRHGGTSWDLGSGVARRHCVLLCTQWEFRGNFFLCTIRVRAHVPILRKTQSRLHDDCCGEATSSPRTANFDRHSRFGPDMAFGSLIVFAKLRKLPDRSGFITSQRKVFRTTSDRRSWERCSMCSSKSDILERY